MNKLKVIAALSCLWAVPAFAAITLQDAVYGSAGYPPAAVTYNSADSVGDVLVATLLMPLTTGLSPQTITVSDNVNSGNWTEVVGNYDNGSGLFTYWFMKVANAAGTPTVTATLSNPSAYGNLVIARFNGFSGTPTIDASLSTTVINTSGTSNNPAISPLVTGHNNELLLMSLNPGDLSGVSTPDGWAELGMTTAYQNYAVVASSGTSIPYSITLGAESDWGLALAAIYDATASAPIQGGFALSPSN